MENIIADIVQKFEEGKIDRRQLIKNLAMAATAAVGFLHYIGIGPNETDAGDEDAARRESEKTP